eukprot:755570-Hanusia_phi.AAC.3
MTVLDSAPVRDVRSDKTSCLFDKALTSSPVLPWHPLSDASRDRPPQEAWLHAPCFLSRTSFTGRQGSSERNTSTTRCSLLQGRPQA